LIIIILVTTLLLLVNHVAHVLNLQADKAVQEIERKYDQKLSECKEESRQYLMRLQEEQAVLVCAQNLILADFKWLFIIFISCLDKIPATVASLEVRCMQPYPCWWSLYRFDHFFFLLFHIKT